MKASSNPHDVSHSSTIVVQFRSLSKSASSNLDDEADGAITLLLFGRGCEAIGAGITVQAERSILDNHCVPSLHARQYGDFVIDRADVILRDSVAQEVDSPGSNRVCSERATLYGGANAQGRQLESLRG